MSLNAAVLHQQLACQCRDERTPAPAAGVQISSGRRRSDPFITAYLTLPLSCLKQQEWFPTRVTDFTEKMLTDMIVEEEFEIKEEEPWFDKQDLEHGTISCQSLSQKP